MEGDRRTPEGVYFLEQRMNGNLGLELYGNLAYVLNYPNPVDRLRGKTGYGIWLHGRGKTLLPRDTQGCVAMQTKELRELGQHFKLSQTPVLIGTTSSSQKDGQELDTSARELKSRLQAWVRAWEQQSGQFFSFYHPNKFSRSGSVPFRNFQSRKENLFRLYSWIDIYLDHLQIIPGPGYWVTSFGQYFRSPSFQSQGVKRLYWQKTEQGVWKIVGREWVPLDLELEEAYLRQAGSRIKMWLQDWKSAWEEADLPAYLDSYHPEATQDARSGRAAIQDHKETIWARERPASIQLENIQVQSADSGFQVTFLQRYQGRQGYTDTGIKSLLLEPQPDTFRIVRETWRPLSSS